METKDLAPELIFYKIHSPAVSVWGDMYVSECSCCVSGPAEPVHRGGGAAGARAVPSARQEQGRVRPKQVPVAPHRRHARVRRQRPAARQATRAALLGNRTLSLSPFQNTSSSLSSVDM